MTTDFDINSSPFKPFKRIPINVVEDHQRALYYIYGAIGAKKLPVEGTTLLHFDSHPDMLIRSTLTGDFARGGRKVFKHLDIENWIVPAVAAGHLGRIVWMRAPWCHQFTDGNREITVGDNPETGYLRVDSSEPYYLSDALYCSELINERKFIFTVAELKATEVNYDDLAKEIDITHPYVLDIDLDFFSTANPFLNVNDIPGLYDLLEPLFRLELPKDDSKEELEKSNKLREKRLKEIDEIFYHLMEHKTIENYRGEKSDVFNEVSELYTTIVEEAKRCGVKPDWWLIHTAGCTRDQGGLPHHISTEEEITQHIESFKNLCKRLPPPVLITIARSTEDGYCPRDQVEMIQSKILAMLKEVFDTERPNMEYSSVLHGPI